jgi:hypothetical protein
MRAAAAGPNVHFAGNVGSTNYSDVIIHCVVHNLWTVKMTQSAVWGRVGDVSRRQ